MKIELGLVSDKIVYSVKEWKVATSVSRKTFLDKFESFYENLFSLISLIADTFQNLFYCLLCIIIF